MCSRALVDSLECYMDDMVDSFQDFVKKSLIIISLAVGALIAVFVYMIRTVNNRTLEANNMLANANNTHPTEARYMTNNGGNYETKGAYDMAGGIRSQPSETNKVERSRNRNKSWPRSQLSETEVIQRSPNYNINKNRGQLSETDEVERSQNYNINKNRGQLSETDEVERSQNYNINKNRGQLSETDEVETSQNHNINIKCEQLSETNEAERNQNYNKNKNRGQLREKYEVETSQNHNINKKCEQLSETNEAERNQNYNKNKNRGLSSTKQRGAESGADHSNAGQHFRKDIVPRIKVERTSSDLSNTNLECRKTEQSTAVSTSLLCSSPSVEESLLNEVKLNGGYVPIIKCPNQLAPSRSNPRMSMTSVPICSSKYFFEQVDFLCIDLAPKWWRGDNHAVQTAVKLTRDVDIHSQS